jgi:serine/threonine protein kinase
MQKGFNSPPRAPVVPFQKRLLPPTSQILLRLQFTSTYSSPERSNSADQRKVDVWAAGCILYELCVGAPLVRSRGAAANVFVAMAQFLDPDWRPPRLPLSMRCWQGLLDAMLNTDAAARPLPYQLMDTDIFACDTRRTVRVLPACVHTVALAPPALSFCRDKQARQGGGAVPGARGHVV